MPYQGWYLAQTASDWASGTSLGKALLWDRQDLNGRPTVLDDDAYPDTGSQHLVSAPTSTGSRAEAAPFRKSACGM